jgi:hypothetical protein
MSEVLQINQVLESVSVSNIQLVEQGDVSYFTFNKDCGDKPHAFILLFNKQSSKVVCSLFMNYPAKLTKPGLELYEILSKVSSQLILGYCNVLEENNEYFISYRSTYIADGDNFTANKSFEYFMSTSFDMVGIVNSFFGS